MGWRPASATRAARSCAARPAATAPLERTSPQISGRCAPSRCGCARSARGPAGGPRRGVHAAWRLRRAQRAAGTRGQAALRQRPQHRGRHRATEGPGRHRQPAPLAMGLPGGRGAGARQPFGVAGAAPRSRLPGESGHAAGAGHRRVIGFVEEWAEKRKELDYETDGIVIKVDDAEAQRSWASSRAPRAGRPPTSSRRSRSRPSSRRSRSTSAAPAP